LKELIVCFILNNKVYKFHEGVIAMDIYTNLNDFNIAEIQVDEIDYFIPENIPVNNDHIVPKDKREPHLQKTREFLVNLLSDLEVITMFLQEIKTAGEDYAVTKNEENLKQVQTAIEGIKNILANNIYSGGAFGHNSYSPLYNFWVSTDENIDQWERLLFGTASWSSEQERISIEGLKLKEIDISKETALWMLLYKEALVLIRTEIGKVKSYLRRLDFIDSYNYIIKNSYKSISILKKEII